MTPLPSPSAPPSPDPTNAASAAVLTAYLNFQHAVADAQSTANSRSPALDKYATDKALAQARVGLLQLAYNGVVFKGAPRFDPTVESLTTTTTPATAVVKDCVDSTDWIPVDRATGKSVRGPGQHLRVVNVATLMNYPGRWVLRTSANDMLRWVPSGVRYITRQDRPRWITAATATTLIQAETGNKVATTEVAQVGGT